PLYLCRLKCRQRPALSRRPRQRRCNARQTEGRRNADPKRRKRSRGLTTTGAFSIRSSAAFQRCSPSSTRSPITNRTVRKFFGSQVPDPRSRSRIPDPRYDRFVANRIKRLIKIVVGFTVLAAGVAMLVLPGPGWVVIAIALAILAGEYVWAR